MNKRILSLLFVLCFGLWGCSNSSPTKASGNNIKNDPGQLETNKCSGSQFSVRVFDTSVNDEAFRGRVADLVSASMNPFELGQVSGAITGSTGVTVTVNLVTDASGNIISNQSQFNLSIHDSYVGQSGSEGGSILPIQIAHTTDSQLAGSYSSQTKQLNLQFSDEYGEISIQGRIANSQFSGTVQFSNFISFDESSPKSGVLGQFQINNCQ